MNDVDIDGGRLTGRNADVGLHSGQSLNLPMSTESQLREKLRKIEALFAGAGTAGERLAAEAALERVRARLGELSRQDPSIEMQFSMPDQWSRHLFLALCRRYGLKPYRYYRQRRNTVMIRAPKRFLDQVLVPSAAGTTISPSTTAEFALICQASWATFLKRCVQSRPRRVKIFAVSLARWT